MVGSTNSKSNVEPLNIVTWGGGYVFRDFRNA